MRNKRLFKGILALLIAVMIGMTGISATYQEVRATEVQNNTLPEGAVFPDNLNTAGYDVVFCIDNSGSVWRQQAIRDEALRSISNLAVGSDIKIGGVYFGDTVQKKIGLTSMKDKEGSLSVISEFLNMTEQNENNRGTNIGNALAEAHALFENQDAARKKIVILFSDGINENAQGSSAYRANANAQTAVQVQRLKEENIPIYCVFLEKNRKDETYLKNLVNYFDSAANHYEGERFKKVTEAEIDQLPKQFAQIFYAMQNNMKYRELSVDSNGRTNFYIPNLGVNRLQLYLHSKDAFEAKLSCAEAETFENESWGDGNSVFISVTNPPVGEWTLQITGSNPAAVSGTIAYYADIMTATQIVPVYSGSVHKNADVKVHTCLYNAKGEKIAVDTVAQVTAEMSFVNKAEEEMVQSFTLTSNGVDCESELFQINDYGIYKFKTRVVYEDFVDLSFSQEGGKVGENAPIVMSQSGMFQAVKVDKGHQFVFEASTLYRDPEGEAVKIVGVEQLNEENPVEVVKENGYIKVTAKKAGNVRFSIMIEDETGQTASVKIEGTVVNKAMISFVIATVGLVIIAVLLMLLATVLKKKRSQSAIETKIRVIEEECQNVYKKIEGIFAAYIKEVKMVSYENYESAVSAVEEDIAIYEEALLAIAEVCQNELTEAQIQDFELEEYFENTDRSNVLQDVKIQMEELTSLRLDCQEWQQKTNEFKESEILSKRSQKYLSCLEEELDGICEKLDKIKREIENNKTAYVAQMKKMDETISNMGSKYCEIEEMLNRKINCDLSVGYKEYVGAKSGKNLCGYYSLDKDIKLMGEGDITTFEELLKGVQTGILVYGYTDEESGEQGLEIRSTTAFRVKEKGVGGEGKKVKRAVLLKGEEYQVMPDELGSIIISVY